ncbi:MAG: beta-ketoacyl-ACP synthase II [Synergistes sp.]|nr:beta-ketoacyl-ACP synthase II [Synergistes sp.]
MTGRVVITGCGAVTPIGIGKEDFWKALEAGKNGVGYIKAFDASEFPVKIAAGVTDFDPERWIGKKDARHMDRVAQFAAAAADLAVADSEIDLESIDKEALGVYIGSGQGGIHTTETNCAILESKGPRRVSPFMVPMMISNMSAALVAIRTGAKGPNMSVASACASSLNSMIEAYNCIVRGDAKIMLTGGSEAAMTRCGLAGFAALKALSLRNDDPATASRPFDAGRDGFVLGEGAGVLLFEEYSHAKARGAHIYAEVVGYGISCDAHHITAPDPDGDGAYRAMAMAIKKAGWQPCDVDLINAHGTSTQLNDKIETLAIKRLLGEEYGSKVMVHSTKSMIGHALGSAGAMETVAVLLAMEHGIVHPTINQFERDPECALNTVPNTAVHANVRRVLINNFGFGGHNAVLALEALGE